MSLFALQMIFMKWEKIIFFALLLSSCCVPIAAAITNPNEGQLKIWEINASNSSSIPNGVFTATKGGGVDTASLVYNPTTVAIWWQRLRR